MKEFHVTKASRDKYQFDEVLFSKNGNVVFANFHSSRELAHRINQKRSNPMILKPTLRRRILTRWD